MANLLDQMIEQISREKHIEPGVIVAAIEDAMVVAARKYYKTDEDLRAKFNAETGQVDVYAVRAIVGEIADPKKEMTLAEASAASGQSVAALKVNTHRALKALRALLEGRER